MLKHLPIFDDYVSPLLVAKLHVVRWLVVITSLRTWPQAMFFVFNFKHHTFYHRPAEMSHYIDDKISNQVLMDDIPWNPHEYTIIFIKYLIGIPWHHDIPIFHGQIVTFFRWTWHATVRSRPISSPCSPMGKSLWPWSMAPCWGAEVFLQNTGAHFKWYGSVSKPIVPL